MRRILIAALVPLVSALLWLAWQFDPPIWEVTFSADGKQVFALCASYDYQHECYLSASLRVWDLETGRQLRTLPVPVPVPNDEWVWDLSSDGKRLAMLKNKRQFEILDTTTFDTIVEWEGEPVKNRWIVQFTPAGDSLLCIVTIDEEAKARHYLECWDVPTKSRTLTELQGRPWYSHATHAPRVVLGWRGPPPNATPIATRIYEVRAGQIAEIADVSTLNVPYAQLFPDGTKAIIHRGMTADIYDLATRSTVRTMRAFNALSFDHFAISPSGSLLGNMNAARNLIIWDAVSGERIHRISTSDLRNHHPHQFVFLPDEKSILNKGFDGKIRIYDLQSERLVRQFPDRQTITFTLIALAGAWAIAWIAAGSRLQPGWPLFDAIVLNLLLFLPVQVYIVRSISRLYIATAMPSIAFAHLIALCILLVFWWVHGTIRWSIRLAGLVAGLAGVCGLMLALRQLEWVAWQVIVGALSFGTVLYGSFVVQRLAHFALSQGEVAATNRTRGRFQWPLRDTFLLVTAAGIFVGIVRYVKPYEMPTWGILFVLANGITLAIVGVVSCWAALSTRGWFLRLSVLILISASIGRGLPELFVGLPIFPGGWYLIQHLACAGVVFVSLLVFRLQGFRLTRPRAEPAQTEDLRDGVKK